MKKIIFLALAVLVLVGCNNSSKNPFGSSLSGRQNANDVIEFHNVALDLYKKYEADYLLKSMDYIKKAEEYILEKQKGETGIKPIRLIFAPMPNGFEDKKVPSGFGEQRDSVSTYFTQMKESAYKVRSAAEEMQRYLSNSDGNYKESDAEKIKKIADESASNVLVFYVNQKRLFALMSPIVEQAEESILSDHPLKDQIISSKRIITLTDRFIDELGVEMDKEEVQTAQLQTTCNEIAQQLAKNKELPKIKDGRKQVLFKIFNEAIEKFVSGVQKMLDNGKEAKGFSEEDLQDVSDNYERMVETYNDFVN